MQFSKSTDYALHALLYLGRENRSSNVGIKELAETMGVSASYLSKIMSKLRQNEIVRAVPGVNGGYELARPAEHITFLEVIQVIEGTESLFECSNSASRQHRMLAVEGAGSNGKADAQSRSECLVENVMRGAERKLYEYLELQTLQSVLDEASARAHGEEEL